MSVTPLVQASTPSTDRRTSSLREWLHSEIAAVLGVTLAKSDDFRRFHQLGLDSANATMLARRLSDWLGRAISPTVIWEYPTIDALVAHLDGDTSRGGLARQTAALASQTHGEASTDPIAVVGIACRFPGQANSPEQFWALLLAGVDAIREVPPERWNLDALYDPDRRVPGKVSTRWGGFLERIDEFDASFFEISPDEAIQMDPQQRLMLELAWEALEDAGVRTEEVAGSRSGVFIGAMWSDYAHLTTHDPALIDPYSATGQDTSIIAARISYVLGLAGPSLVVNTACSSSLVATHLACESLRSGECDLALAGGVHVMASVLSTVAMSKFGGIGTGGRCRSFDDRADGYVRGEGGGLVILKRLSRALRDGDRVYCLLRGSAINNDGFSNGLTAPNPKAQESVLRQAYANAGVEPESVQYVETHGPGTPLGDPIEAGALGAVLCVGRPADRPLRLGTVKTNLGHLEAAAGIAGLIKVALSMHHRVIPKSLHFEVPNRLIAFEALRLEMQREPTAWPSPEEGGPARPTITTDTTLAGVSSFGFGGTNSHVVLEGMPARPRLLRVGAPSAQALSDALFEILRALSKMQDESELDALCDRAGLESEGQPRRAAFVGRSPTDMFDVVAPAIKLGRAHRSALDSSQRPRVVFVFSGQGSQWLGMGRTLLRTEPVFRAAMRACDEGIFAHAGWSVLDELLASASQSRLGDDRVVQILIFAMQISLAALLRSWGVVPDVVMAHSVGESAAAHVAGILSLEDAIRVTCARTELIRALPRGQGAMALVGLSAEEASRAMAGHSDRVTIAAYNGPRTVILSGEPDALEAVIVPLEKAGVYVGRIKVDYASHSRQVDVIREPLIEALRGLAPKRGDVRFLSTVRGENIEGPECVAEYWFENERGAVRFQGAVETLLDEGPAIFLEVSPHPILERALRTTIAGRASTVLPSMRRDEPEDAVFFETLRTLYTRGVSLGRQAPVPSSVALPLSAKTPEALRELAKGYRAWLSAPASAAPLSDVAYTAAVRRSHHAHRIVVRGASRADLVEALDAFEARRDSPSVLQGPGRERAAAVFVFSGEGPQWPGMGRELSACAPVFHRAMLECEAALGKLDGVHATMFAVQVALARLWQSWGVEPAAVVGDGMGEVAAAHVAGVLGLDDAARVVAGEGLAGLVPARGHVPFHSTVTGSYWAANSRGPAPFAETVHALRASGHEIFLEIGATPVRSPVIEDALRGLGASGVAIPSLRRDEPAHQSLLHGFAQLFIHGAISDWTKVHPDGAQVVSLPPYPWQRKRYWLTDA